MESRLVWFGRVGVCKVGMSGVRLVAWKLKENGVSAKVAIPVSLVLALVSFAIWIAGALMIGESDDSKMKRG